MLEKHDHETGGVSIVEKTPTDAITADAPFTSADVVAGLRMIPETEGRVEPVNPRAFGVVGGVGADSAAIRSALDRLGRAVEEIHAAGDALRALIGA